MANEGEYPKVNGDILYASEASRFANSSHCLFIGSLATVGSATAAQSCGSIFIGAGSISNPVWFSIVANTRGGTSTHQAQIMLSGASANGTLSFYTDNYTDPQFGIVNFVVGSPFNGHGQVIHSRSNDSAASQNPRSSVNINNIDTDSDMVIDFRMISDNGSGGYYQVGVSANNLWE